MVNTTGIRDIILIPAYSVSIQHMQKIAGEVISKSDRERQKRFQDSAIECEYNLYIRIRVRRERSGITI